MGRHSAPESVADSAADGGAANPNESTGPVLTMPSRPGRHSRPEPSDPPHGGLDLADAPTGEQPAVAAEQTDDRDGGGPLDLLTTSTLPDADAAPDAPGAPDTSATPVGAERRGGTAADIALVRRHGAVRARVIAGALVPFVVYAVVLIAIGATVRQGLLWIFIPLVAAGVLVGVFLDAGHKRYRGQPPDDGPPRADPVAH